MSFHTASAHKISLWGRKLSRFSANVIFFEIKPKLRDVLVKNVGFPEQIRDGRHLFDITRHHYLVLIVTSYYKQYLSGPWPRSYST